MNLTLLYINSEAVIPAKAGIQLRNTGFRVKPGMTNKFLNHYTKLLPGFYNLAMYRHPLQHQWTSQEPVVHLQDASQ